MGVVALDRFPGADNASSLGSLESGQAWNPLSGTWRRLGNKALLGGAGGTQKHVVVACGSADVTVYCDVFLSALANRAECGLVFRVADDNNLLMLRMGKSGAGGTGMVLYKRVAGAFTIISNNPSGLIFNNNQTYRVAAALSGASVVVTIDGTVHMNVTLSAGDQTTFGANTLHGLRVSHALTEDDTGSSFANFVVVSALGSYGLVLG